MYNPSYEYVAPAIGPNDSYNTSQIRCINLTLPIDTKLSASKLPSTPTCRGSNKAQDLVTLAPANQSPDHLLGKFDRRTGKNMLHTCFVAKQDARFVDNRLDSPGS